MSRLERLLADTKRQWEESTAALAAKSSETDSLSALLEVTREEAAVVLVVKTEEAERQKAKGEGLEALL